MMASMTTRTSPSAANRLDFGRSRCSAASISASIRRSLSFSQHAQHHETKDDGRQALDNEQPLPPRQAEYAVHQEQQSRDRPADHGGQRDRDQKPREHAGAIL